MEKKKIIAIVAVAVAAAVLIGVYFLFIAPKGNTDTKTVNLEIKIGDEITKKEYKTSREFVVGLMEDNKEELGAEIIEDTIGKMIVTLCGYTPNADKHEYFCFYVDGVMSNFGISETPLEDGKTYSFVLETY